MTDREKIYKGLELHFDAFARCEKCPYQGVVGCTDELLKDALDLLKETEPRVMTLKEVIDHYSLPSVFVDDLNAQEDYLQDIAPLYFDFPSDDPWNVHWRRYQDVKNYLDSDSLKESYGKKWRCWTGRPTDEQRQETKWMQETDYIKIPEEVAETIISFVKMFERKEIPDDVWEACMKLYDLLEEKGR